MGSTSVHVPAGHRRGWVSAVAASLVLLLVASACSSASNDAAVAAQRPAAADVSGDPVELEAVAVDPPAAFDIDGEVAGQGYDLHPAGAVEGPLTVRLAAGSPTDADHLPMVGHYTDGRWDWEFATYDAETGTFTIEASDFSYRVPYWSPVKDAVAAGLDSLMDHATGKTDPPGCKGEVPDWADITLFSTNAVHTCWHDPQGDGAPELLIKSNRAAFLIVTVPSNVSYVWVEEQPDWARPLLSSVSGSDRSPESVLLLPPGKSVSFGWDRPLEPGPVPVEPVVSVYTNQATILMSSASSLVDLFADTDRQLAVWLAAALLYHQCSTKLAGIDPLAADFSLDLLSGLEFFREFVTCVAGGISPLTDPAEATGAVYDIWGDQLLKLDSKTQADVATMLGGKLTTLGRIAKVFTTALLAGKAVTGFHDGIVDALVGMDSAAVTLSRPIVEPGAATQTVQLPAETEYVGRVTGTSDEAAAFLQVMLHAADTRRRVELDVWFDVDRMFPEDQPQGVWIPGSYCTDDPFGCAAYYTFPDIESIPLDEDGGWRVRGRFTVLYLGISDGTHALELRGP